MEAEEVGSDSASLPPPAPPLSKTHLLNSSSVDQASSSSSSSVCGGLNTVPSNTHLHLTAAAVAVAGHQNSVSDDSGLVHTNSSISDSSRLYLNCKHDFELIESDGEVSQFDSLDNSEGGMSAENFNTLKKGPLVAPIDPPPEFQDSPQTTMLRRNTTTGYQEFAQLLIKDILGEAFLSILHKHNNNNNNKSQNESRLLCPKDRDQDDESIMNYSHTIIKRTRISASDPQLNITTMTGETKAQPPTAMTVPENIYDEPSDSTRNSDDIEVDYYISKQLSASLARKKSSTLSANSQQLSLKRPNSRNSLQSRLSSSHNSLATTGACKVDDTTFITQAMSHDPLMSRQSIIDFYNVPLDSDIYALPVDVVVSGGEEEGQDEKCRIIKGPLTSSGGINCHRKSHSRRLKLSSNGTNGMSGTGGHGRLSLMPAVTPSSSNGGMSKSSEAKRRLFRKAQTKAASVSHSQLFHVTNGTTVEGKGGVQVTPVVNAKRFSAPDGLGVVEVVKHGNNKTKRGKREKRSSSSSTHHGQAHQVQAPVAVHNSKSVAVVLTSESSDEGPVEVVTTIAGQGSTPGTGADVDRDKGRKESKRKEKQSVKPTISSKTMHPSKVTGSKESKDKDRPRASIPVSTSFTSQSSIQSIQGVTAGVASGTPESNGKTTKREARDATKRGHNQFSTNLKQKFCSIFRFRNKSSSQLAEYEYNDSYTIAASSGSASSGQKSSNNGNNNNNSTSDKKKSSAATIMLRALPPLPKRAPPEVPLANGTTNGGELNRRRPPAELPPMSPETVTNGVGGVEIVDSNNNDVLSTGESSVEHAESPLPTRVDFASNLETIKQYGWYWGPISCQAAEKILSNEPDGSFIVRDSSDDHYIFSLTFKLNNCVRHVRIEQDKGTFSFGTLAKFKARTIVEFIEQALEYSRSGRYLFFLHRRPEHGPMRVQLKNPVSRFKHIQSLQHMCRFVIMKAIVRKDLISSLPLPNRLKDYLSYKNCYTEHFIEDGVGEGDGEGTAEGESVATTGDTTATTTSTEQEGN